MLFGISEPSTVTPRIRLGKAPSASRLKRWTEVFSKWKVQLVNQSCFFWKYVFFLVTCAIAIIYGYIIYSIVYTYNYISFYILILVYIPGYKSPLSHSRKDTKLSGTKNSTLLAGRRARGVRTRAPTSRPASVEEARRRGQFVVIKWDPF